MAILFLQIGQLLPHELVHRDEAEAEFSMQVHP